MSLDFHGENHCWGAHDLVFVPFSQEKKKPTEAAEETGRPKRHRYERSLSRDHALFKQCHPMSGNAAFYLYLFFSILSLEKWPQISYHLNLVALRRLVFERAGFIFFICLADIANLGSGALCGRPLSLEGAAEIS
jgi:hypothetical protein